MHSISPKDIERYTQCPKYAEFAWGVEKANSQNSLILQKTISSISLYYLRHNEPPEWRQISNWAESYLVGEVGEYSGEGKGLLAQLGSWYRNHYLKKECFPGYINLPIALPLGYGITYRDNIPIVGLANKIRLYDFKELTDKDKESSYNSIKLYNDLFIHIRVWGFLKKTALKPEQYIRYVIGPRSITPYRISITDPTLEKSEKMVEQVLRGVKNNVFYPSFSRECTCCPYKGQCNF
jgi:hypothetical protein